MLEKSGIIILNKPPNMSSFLAVKIVKGILSAKKAGHMGTLDPLASGVLVIGINKGTKLFDKFLKSDKEYIVDYEFGYETDTLDCEGKITNKKPETNITFDDLNKVIKKFIGKQLQTPPAYSAKKINGKKAYELAREGKTFELPDKEVEVYNLEVLEKIKTNIFRLRINCSSGFYVRSLGRDLAKEMGTFCTTINIIRTKCCGFDVFQSHSIEDLKIGNYTLIPLERIN